MEKVKSYVSHKKITVLATLVLAITLPTLVFVLSHVQNFSSKADVTTMVEAESGTISGNIAIKSSVDASGGKYILFGGSTQPPTPTTYKAPTPTPTIQQIAPTVTPRPTSGSILGPTPTTKPLQSHGNGQGENRNGNNH